MSVGSPTAGTWSSSQWRSDNEFETDRRDYRLGYRLGGCGGAETTFDLGVDAQRRERPVQGGTDNGTLGRARARSHAPVDGEGAHAVKGRGLAIDGAGGRPGGAPGELVLADLVARSNPPL